MSTRPCARCGTRIANDLYLCADCRDERTSSIGSPTAAMPSTVERQGQHAPAEAPTWRGKPVPRGMALPSRTQYHGTMFAFIAAAVVITMAAAVLVNKGIGPFVVTQVQPSEASGVVSVTGLVRNGGTNPGRARCVATWTNTQGGRQQTGVFQTAVIRPERASVVSIPLANVAVIPEDLAIDCK